MRAGTDGVGTANSDESGRSRTERVGQFSEQGSEESVMVPSRAQVLALLVVASALLATPLAAAPGAQQPAAGGIGGLTDPSPGAHLTGIVAVQNSTVGATVAEETFQARLANATSDDERAALVDRRLEAIERRLAAARERSEELARASEQGSVTDEASTARAAGLAETAARLAAAANATERAAATLPADRRSALRVAERAAAIRADARRLRERTSGAADAIDGVGEQSQVRPISRDAVADLVERVGAPEISLPGVAASERVNLHVRRANGTTPVFGVHIEDGRVTAVEDQPFENPTLSVYTDYRVVDRVRRADDPAAALRTAIQTDGVRYDGRGIGNSLKYGLVRLGALLAG